MKVIYITIKNVEIFTLTLRQYKQLFVSIFSDCWLLDSIFWELSSIFDESDTDDPLLSSSVKFELYPCNTTLVE